MSRFIDRTIPFYLDDGGVNSLGTVYFGEPGQDAKTNPAQIYFDSDLTIPAPATQSLTAGGQLVGNLYAPGELSLIADNSMAVQVESYLYWYQDGSDIVFEDIEIQDGVLTYSPANTVIKPNASRVEVAKAGGGVDGTLLINDIDYTSTGSSITLSRSYPGGILRLSMPVYSGVDLSQASSFINVKDFGAVGDGVTDDTLAVQAALDSGSRLDIYFPAGVYKISSTLTVADKFVRFRGAGIGATKILFTVSSTFLSMTRTGAETARYQVEDFELVTDVASGGTAFFMEQDLSSGVIGGVDLAHFNNIVLEGDGAGYWTIGAEQRNCGGVYYDNFSIRNNNSLIAQNDVNTKGIFVNNSNASINVIRALHLSNFYIQRVNKGIEFDVNGSIESFYCTQGEIVGGDYGVYVNSAGSSSLGAVSIGTGVHMDNILWNVFVTTGSTLNICRITGSDLRINNNGAPHASTGGNVNLQEGEVHTYTGTHFSVPTKTAAPASTWIGIDSDNSIRVTVDSCSFRHHDVGIVLPGDADSVIGDNSFAVVVSKYSNNTDFTKIFSASEMLTTYKEDYADNIDSLALATVGETFTTIQSGASGGPVGEPTTGGVVNTKVFDGDRAYQWFHNANGIWYRIKNSGVWGAWAAK